MTTPYIVFVDDYPHANIGGGEQHLLRVARGCREWGYRVDIVCIPGSGLEAEARSAGIEILRMPAGRRPGVGRELRRLFDAAAPDIVHVHGFYAMAVACPAARRAGVPFILTTVHSMPNAALELRPGAAGRIEFALRSRLYRRAARSIDRFVCVVNAARDELLGLGIPAQKLTVIANGIPDPRAGGSPVSKPEGSSVLVGSVGRLERAKGYLDFIEAAAIILGRDERVRFRLVGQGSEHEALRQRAARLGLGERFEFAGWSGDPIAEIATMDVYVVSSITETTNLTLLEAMGLGVPVVATDVGGISDAVADGVSGRLVPAHRPELLAKAIFELGGDPEARASMGAAGRERFEAAFTLDRMLEAHRALYSGLLGQDT